MVVKEIHWYQPHEWQPESFREIVFTLLDGEKHRGFLQGGKNVVTCTDGSYPTTYRVDEVGWWAYDVEGPEVK